MTAHAQHVDPAAERVVRIRPAKQGLPFSFRDLWEYRELVYFLVWRDVKVRYKQTALGISWAILQPVTSMIVFSIIFGRVANIPSEGVPYPLFAFAGLLPWYYFSSAVNTSGMSVVANASLVTKVFFPRAIIPLSAVVRPVVDFALSFLVLIALFIWYGVVPPAHAPLFVVFLLLALVAALGVGTWFAALGVRYRDVPFVLPFAMQIWFYATPIVYPLSIVPDRWQWVYSLNPLVAVIDGFRWALLGKEPPDALLLSLSTGAGLILLIGGFFYFRRVERQFADVI